MNNNDFDKTLFDNIDDALDITLEADVAECKDVGATIKAAAIDQVQVNSGVTLLANSDGSQNITMPLAGTLLDKTVVPESPDRKVDATVSSAETILDSKIDSGIAATTISAGKTLISSATEKSTMGMSGLNRNSDNITEVHGAISYAGGTVSFSGGSISVNVRPRSVASTILSKDEFDDRDNGLDSLAFSDYELIEKLGEGGMGIVYSARQSSIDRSIALKMIKSDVVSEEAKSKFLVEAVVTGDLDHPNIVPVHDLGVDTTGNIFYAMKQVAGVEWSKVIKKKSKSENLDILLRVCDAVAFAHDRGVIHRDLKPENVMLGAFGEVLVMDWGLAVAVKAKAKAEAVSPNTGIAGTPAYLAPEMARAGTWKMLGFCSDIYLLGAILFEIITGKRVHTGRNVRDCLKNAAKNIIVKVEDKGELIDIAYKAMATNPVDRYLNVKDFQQAIRDYLSHSESIMLSEKAERDLEIAEKTEEYDDYVKALFGFKQAVDLWNNNSAAAKGEIKAGVLYASIALKKGDLDLGLSLVTDAEEFDSVKKELTNAKELREKHQSKLKLLTRGVAALGIVIVTISIIAALWIQRERTVAIEQREEAIKQEKIAIEQREEAKKQTIIAMQQREEAQKQEIIAKEKRLLAQAESKRANEQARIADEQRAIALKEKSLAESETKRANEQTEIAKKARNIAESEREKAEKSEEKAITAIEKMINAQTQEQLEKARREAAELTAKNVQAELSSRDELKDNRWWTLDAQQAHKLQVDMAKKYNLPIDKVVELNGVKLEFKLIPPGKFGMGSRVDEIGRSSEEYLHRVEISKPFYIADTEMTMKAWYGITGEEESGEGNYPVWNISYNDINKIIPVVKERLPEGWDVKLPTEAQWEWACRGGTNTPYYSGSTKDDLRKIGYTGVEFLVSAKPVKQLEPNVWGLYDMIGNLAEWCEDMYVRNGYLSDKVIQVDPVVTSGGKHYVVRGGAWSNLSEHCRAAYRSYANKNSRYNFLGFRLVLVPPLK